MEVLRFSSITPRTMAASGVFSADTAFGIIGTRCLKKSLSSSWVRDGRVLSGTAGTYLCI